MFNLRLKHKTCDRHSTGNKHRNGTDKLTHISTSSSSSANKTWSPGSRLRPWSSCSQNMPSQLELGARSSECRGDGALSPSWMEFRRQCGYTHCEIGKGKKRQRHGMQRAHPGQRDGPFHIDKQPTVSPPFHLMPDGSCAVTSVRLTKQEFFVHRPVEHTSAPR